MSSDGFHTASSGRGPIETQEDLGFSPHHHTGVRVETPYGFLHHFNPRAKARGNTFFNNLIETESYV